MSHLFNLGQALGWQTCIKIWGFAKYFSFKINAPWEVVCKLSWPHEHVASLVRPVKGLDLLGLLLGLLLSVGDVHQVAVSQIPHGMASSANLLVHLGI